MPIKMKKTEPTKEWLDQSGRFLFGKYGPNRDSVNDVGELAEDIAETDPGYIRWIVDNVEDILEIDRDILSQYLTYAQRRR
jgi:hypothetical protein